MKDALMYPTAGSGTSILGMIAGMVSYSNVLEAILLGAAGALGGILIKYVIVKPVQIGFKKLIERCKQ